MDILTSSMLGVIEGVTEFLPISSTGHLILASSIFHIPESFFTTSFRIIIQFGAILAVIVIYWKKLWNMSMIKTLIVGFIPTGIIGLALYKVAKMYLLGNTTVVLWALLLGGIALIVFELWYKCRQIEETMETETVTYKQAAMIGLFQSIAIVPGVSRSAATTVGGLMLGLKRTTIVEFTFLLAVPTMLAAGGLDLVKNYSVFSMDQFGVLAVGFIVSFIVALGTIKFLLSYIRKHDFIAFGIYRIALVLIFWLVIR